MKRFEGPSLVFLVLVSGLYGFSAQGAILKCELKLGRQTLVSVEHPIEDRKSLLPMTFNLVLDSTPYHGVVNWQYDKGVLSVHQGESGDVPVSAIQEWHAPLEETLFVRLDWNHPDSTPQVVCHVDVSDGISWNWRFFRYGSDNDLAQIKIQLDTLADLSKMSAGNPSDEKRIDDALCMLIGGLFESRYLDDLGFKVATIDGDSANSKHFPGLMNFFYDTFYVDLVGMRNFCVDGTLAGSRPVPYGVREKLLVRVNELYLGLNKIDVMIKAGFPSQPPLPLF